MLVSSWGLCHQKSCITILVHQKFMQPGANMLYDAGLNFGASGCPYEVVMSFKQRDGCHLFCFAQALRRQSGSLQLRCKCTSQQSERIVNVAQHAHWHVQPQQYLAFARSEIQSGYHSTSFHYSWTSTPQTQWTLYCSDPSLSILVPGHLPIALFYADVCIGLHWAFQAFPKAAD